MKKLILIGGPMGIGKTTTAQLIVKRKTNCVWLDGDWCWEQGCDWHFDKYSRDMAFDNICYLLVNFMKNPAFDNIILSWVLHLQSIKDEIYERLALYDYETVDISLICDSNELNKRLKVRYEAEAKASGDDFDNVNFIHTYERTLERMRCYEKLSSHKIDVSTLTPDEVYQKVCDIAHI